MAINDFYKLVTQYTFLGEIMQNRYYYRKVVEDGGDAGALINSFTDQVWPSLEPVLHPDCLLIQSTCINLNNPLDFFEILHTGYQGSAGGAAAAPYDCWYFRYSRESREFRPGRKSIGGISQGQTEAGAAVPAAIPLLNDLANALEDNLTRVAGGTDEWAPYLVREIVGVPPIEFTPVTNVGFAGVSTQNTRKFGRGL
ncbi:MAG: hypothetical protein [Circular genetic element sp.]|nr:MAG: hypothetical protein [Circular genetic element sp.]